MTRELRSTMELHARTMDDSQLDLSAVLAEGERRVRRRRWATAVGVAVAASVLALAVPFAWAAIGEGDGERAQVAGQETSGIVWASGSTIHVGETSVDVGHEVHAFVETSGGFVFVDPDGGVWSWHGSTVTREGTTHVADYETQLLVSDGAVASWLDVDAGEFVALEAGSAGEEHRAVAADLPRSMRPTSPDGDSDQEQEDTPGPGSFDVVEPGVRALVDGDLVAVDARGIIRINLASGEVETLAADHSAFEVNDGEGGQLLVTLTSEEGDAGINEATYLTSDLADPGEPLPVRGGDISPDGAWVMSENSAANSDDFTIVEVATGEAREPEVKKEYDFFTGFAWTGGNSYVAIGMDRATASSSGGADDEWDIEFLECTVDGGCRKAPQSMAAAGVQLPIGLHIDS